MLIIPAIDMRGGRCVRLFQGDYARETVYGDNPAEQAVKWMNDGAEIIHLVDLDGAKAGHPVNVEPIRRICESVNIPCEIGGGIRTEQDAELLFNAGVSRVILGTVACENPEIAKRFIEKFGPEKVVVGIDAKDGKVAVRGWIESRLRWSVPDYGTAEAADAVAYLLSAYGEEGALPFDTLRTLAAEKLGVALTEADAGGRLDVRGGKLYVVADDAQPNMLYNYVVTDVAETADGKAVTVQYFADCNSFFRSH